MSFNDKKIAQAEINSLHVQASADKFVGSAANGKAIFDALPEKIAEKYNLLVDEMAVSLYTKSETDGQINQKIIDIGTGDMAKGIYDTNNDGKVNAADSADKFGGQLPEFYATAESDKTKLPLTGGTMTGPAVGMTAPIDTAVQFRNMVIYPAGTDLATIKVPAGTIICILK